MAARKKHRAPLDIRGLIGNEEIFRVTIGKRRDAEVTAWLEGKPAELREIAKRWFEEMRNCGDDVRELMHDGCPVACIEDAPFGYVNTFKSHVNVGFFYGATLPDEVGLLEGAGKRMRHVKLRPDVDVDTNALRALIRAAYTDIKIRLRQS